MGACDGFVLSERGGCDVEFDAAQDVDDGDGFSFFEAFAENDEDFVIHFET